MYVSVTRDPKKESTHVVNKDQTCGSSVKVSSTPITPKYTRDSGRDDDRHGEQEPKVVLVLPTYERVVGEVRAIRDTWFTTRVDDHPADMRPQETMMGAVGIQVGVGVTMVGAMTSGPPLDGTLNSSCSHETESVLEWQRGIVRTMGP
jgi:hypothetical protein